MSNAITLHTNIAPATQSAQDKIEELRKAILTRPQVKFVTEHLLHAGMYTRTAILPANVAWTAVLIAPPTVLITVGDLDIWSNDEVTHASGYTVFPGSAGRKIAFVTHSMVGMSMMFPCTAKTVDEAQKEFTVEYKLLPPLSDVDRHKILITGE